jgi:hypothetical protein
MTVSLDKFLSSGGATVQRGTYNGTITKNSGYASIALPSIDSSKSIVLIEGGCAFAGDHTRSLVTQITAQIISDTELRIYNRWAWDNLPVHIDWQVITFEGECSVQRGYTAPFTMANNGSYDISIASIDTTKSLLIHRVSDRYVLADGMFALTEMNCYLHNGTTVRVDNKYSVNSTTYTCQWEVITFE